MLVAILLSDGVFASQTKEKFECPFSAKTRAFSALVSAVELAALDFAVAFPSVSEVLGNAGRTRDSSCRCSHRVICIRHSSSFGTIRLGARVS